MKASDVPFTSDPVIDGMYEKLKGEFPFIEETEVRQKNLNIKHKLFRSKWRKSH